MLVVTIALSTVLTDLARPSTPSLRLASEPNLWLTHDFINSEVVDHLLSKVPKDEAKFEPCIGQIEEFDSKRCTMLPAQGDEVMEAFLAKVETVWNVDVSRLQKSGVPIIRYLPGAPPVGKHGDEDRHGMVPNATLVAYLTASERGGHTLFPEANVSITPRRGSILAFQNVDTHGRPHPLAKHSVSAVPKDATHDRIVIQIPIAHSSEGRRYAYPEHVSGMKNHAAGNHGNSAPANPPANPTSATVTFPGKQPGNGTHDGGLCGAIACCISPPKAKAPVL